jgi:hypothetical protein
MALTPEKTCAKNRPGGRYEKKFRKRFSIPQPFPQVGPIFVPHLQTLLPKGLIEMNLGSFL